jgi:hypothetical protein
MASLRGASHAFLRAGCRSSEFKFPSNSNYIAWLPPLPGLGPCITNVDKIRPRPMKWKSVIGAWFEIWEFPIRISCSGSDAEKSIFTGWSNLLCPTRFSVHEWIYFISQRTIYSDIPEHVTSFDKNRFCPSGSQELPSVLDLELRETAYRWSWKRHRAPKCKEKPLLSFSRMTFSIRHESDCLFKLDHSIFSERVIGTTIATDGRGHVVLNNFGQLDACKFRRL